MAAIDMTGQLREWVAKAVNDGCLGEDFAWDVRWDIKAPILAYTVLLSMANPLLGQGPVIQTFQLSVSSLTEEHVREGVHNVIGALRNTRTKIIALAHAAAN